jgi:hypothetical protein
MVNRQVNKNEILPPQALIAAKPSVIKISIVAFFAGGITKIKRLCPDRKKRYGKTVSAKLRGYPARYRHDVADSIKMQGIS